MGRGQQTLQDHFSPIFGNGRGAERTYTAQAFLGSLSFKKAPSPSPIPPSSFSPTRWPYTYAYDYVRSHTPGAMSRSDVARTLLSYVDGDEIDKEHVCIELAAAHCAEGGIAVPSDLLSD